MLILHNYTVFGVPSKLKDIQNIQSGNTHFNTESHSAKDRFCTKQRKRHVRNIYFQTMYFDN